MHGDCTNPFSGGISSGHIGGSQRVGGPLHSREVRQVRLVEPLSENEGSQEKKQVPFTVWELQLMEPFSGASSWRRHCNAASKGVFTKQSLSTDESYILIYIII